MDYEMTIARKMRQLEEENAAMRPVVEAAVAWQTATSFDGIAQAAVIMGEATRIYLQETHAELRQD